MHLGVLIMWKTEAICEQHRHKCVQIHALAHTHAHTHSHTYTHTHAHTLFVTLSNKDAYLGGGEWGMLTELTISLSSL